MSLMKKIILDDLIDALDQQTIELHGYYDMEEGKFIHISDYDFLTVGYDEFNPIMSWQVERVKFDEEVRSNSDRYLQLPNEFNRNEFEIMESFIRTIPYEQISETLLEKIRGRGAFRRFRHALHHFKLEPEWDEFKKKELKRIAIEWCHKNQFDYE